VEFDNEDLVKFNIQTQPGWHRGQLALRP